MAIIKGYKGDIFERVAAAKKSRAAKIEEYKTRLAEAEAEKAKHDASAESALKNESVEDYMAARNASRSAEDKATFYTRKIDELEAAPLFDNRKYSEVHSQIMAAVEKEKREKLPEAAKQIRAGYDALNSFVETISKANEALTIIYSGRKTGAQINAMEYAGVRNAVYRVGNMEALKEYWAANEKNK